VPLPICNLDKSRSFEDKALLEEEGIVTKPRTAQMDSEKTTRPILPNVRLVDYEWVRH